MSSENIRTAQFGGVGGGGSGSPFAPGKSPIGRGGTNRGGGEINIYMDEDDSFEKLICRTHLDLQQNNINDDNIEKQLTPQHKFNDGELNYTLSSGERLRLKFRLQLQNYKKSLEDHANSILKNSPKYIQEHYHPKPEHMMTLEERLKERRKFDDTKKRSHKYEDDVPPQIKPERYHPVISNNQDNIRIADQWGVSKRNQFTDEYPNEKRNEADEYKYKHFPDGQWKSLGPEDGFQGLEEYLNESDAANRSYYSSGYNETTMLDNPYPDSQYIPKVNADNLTTQNNNKYNIPDNIDVFQPIESNLNKKKFPNNNFDHNNQPTDSNNIGQEDKGVEEKYDGFGQLGRYSPRGIM